LAEETITIRFRVDTSELEKAVGLLKELLGPLGEGQKLAIQGGQAFQRLTTPITGASGEISSLRQELMALGSSLGLTGRKLEDFTDIAEVLVTTKLPTEQFKEAVRTLRDLTGGVTTIKNLTQNIEDLRSITDQFSKLDAFRRLPGELQISSSSMEGLTQQFRQFGASLGLQEKALDSFARRFAMIATMKIPSRELNLLARRIGELYDLDPSVLVEGAKRFRSELDRMARESRRLDEITGKFIISRWAMRAFYSEMGAAGRVFRNMTQQIYWLGIGIMFVTMSYSRLLQRQISARQRALSLARAIKSLRDAQEEAHRTMIEYGRGSEEYREAIGRVYEAEESLNLMREQVRFSILQEQFALIQLAFGAIPVVINSMRLLMDSYWLLNSASIIRQSIQRAEITGNWAAIPGFQMLANAIGFEAAQHFVAAQAAAMHHMALVSLVTFGIGAAVAIGGIAWSFHEVNRQMEEATRKAEQLAEKFSGGVESANAFRGGSSGIIGVAEASEEASRELKILSKNIEEVPFEEFVIPPIEIERNIRIREEYISSRPPRIEDQYQYIIRRFVDKEEEIQPGVQIIKREFLGESPPIQPMVQNIIRNYIGQEPSIRPRSQLITRVFTGEEPPITEKVQVVNRIFRGFEEIQSPVIQEVNRILREDIEEPPEVTQYVDRVLIRPLPSIGREKQEVEREIVEEVPDILPSIQEVSRVLVEDVPEMSPVTQEVRRRLIEDIPSIRNLNENIRGRRNNTYFVNITFPSLTIREEADIVKIGEMIDSIFQKEYYAGGGD